MENELRLIGGRIRQARRQRGLRLSDVSVKAGCSESMLSKIENGRVVPSLTTLCKIANALDTKVSVLLSEDTEPWVVTRSTEREPVDARHDHRIDASRLVPTGARSTLEAYVLDLPPGATFLNGFPRHGESLAYVLEGAVALDASGREYELAAGDAFHTNPDMEYRCRNTGPRRTALLLVTVAPRP